MVSIYVLLIVFLITFLVVAALGRSWFHRRLRRPELLAGFPSVRARRCS